MDPKVVLYLSRNGESNMIAHNTTWFGRSTHISDPRVGRFTGRDAVQGLPNLASRKLRINQIPVLLPFESAVVVRNGALDADLVLLILIRGNERPPLECWATD